MSDCPQRPKSKLPQPYYNEDGITIYHGDCRDIMPKLGQFDLMLTDPPYGIGESKGKNKSRGHKAVAQDYGNDDWDNEAPNFLPTLIPQCANSIIFGGNFFALTPQRCWLVWDKDNTGDFADAELAWTNLKMAVRLKKYRWNGMLQGNMKEKEARFHPTQKPVPVMEWCLQLANPKGIIIDPFMGSGTTLIAAKNFSLQAIGIEREEKYCKAAVHRLAQRVLKL